jgi:hypothetical protein
MGHVAEQRGDDGQNGGDEPGKDIQPSTPSQPAAQQPLDEEQLRQFQQFQQFQDYLKFSEAQREGGGELVSQQPQPPAPRQNWLPAPTGEQPRELAPAGPSRPKAPTWLKRLGGKILGWIVALVIIGLALSWGYHRLSPSSANDNRPAAETGGGTYHTNRLLSRNPYQAVRAVYDGIGKNDPNRQLMAGKSCGPMREDIQQKFAVDMGYTDCAQAAYGLAAQVTNLNAYIESIPSYVSAPYGDKDVTVYSCQFGIHGGPSLGTFTVSEVENGQWLITGHSADPTTCPALTPTP